MPYFWKLFPKALIERIAFFRPVQLQIPNSIHNSNIEAFELAQRFHLPRYGTERIQPKSMLRRSKLLVSSHVLTHSEIVMHTPCCTCVIPLAPPTPERKKYSNADQGRKGKKWSGPGKKREKRREGGRKGKGFRVRSLPLYPYCGKINYPTVVQRPKGFPLQPPNSCFRSSRRSQ